MAIVDEKKREDFIEEPVDDIGATTTTTTTTGDTTGIGCGCGNSNSGDENIYQKCATPQTIFAVGTSFSYFLAENLNRVELETLLNILSLIVSNISAIITQIEICKGESVVSLPE